jgi:hypothetical protein
VELQVAADVARLGDLVRGKGGLVGAAVDPLSSHDCGNQRYLAIPWLDACLSARLPKTAGDPLVAMPTDEAWLAPPTGTEAAAKFRGIVFSFGGRTRSGCGRTCCVPVQIGFGGRPTRRR